MRPLRGHSWPWSDCNKEVLSIPQSYSITGNSASDCLLPYPGHSLVGFLPLCRDTICVFYIPSLLGHQNTRWESFTPLQRCSLCVLHPQLIGPPGRSLGEFYPSAEMQSVCSTSPADWATRTLVGRVLPLCRDAVCVFYIPSWLGYQDARWESFTPLQRCSLCVLHPQPIRPPGHSLGEFYPSAEMQSAYSTTPSDWANYKLRNHDQILLDFIKVPCSVFNLNLKKS